MTAIIRMALSLLAAGLQAAEAPRLVLQITVDQLRGDMLPRFRDRFGEGGFKWLLEHGAYFANAHYDSTNTMTGPGHATLVTGAYAREHGVPTNDWFDRASGREVYCVADPKSPVIGEPPSADGFSPAQLTASTLGDELVAGRPGSRAFAVAGKDRSAIIPGGHLGKAFWFSDRTGAFVSSTFYYAALPGWATAWNEKKLINRYRPLQWQLLRERATYRATAAENPNARPTTTIGQIFPHPLVAKSDALFVSALRFTPFLDDYTAAFVRELVTREKLGQGRGPDYLSIGFSSQDYVGHAFGPNSLEYEDALLRLDATLAELFRFLEQTLKLDRVLIVLSSDHGVGDVPESLLARGLDARRIPLELKQQANAALRGRLGIDEDLVVSFMPPGFYLDEPKLAAGKLDRALVENALAEIARGFPGVAYAFTRTELMRGGGDDMLQKARRGFHPQRSGDVVIVQRQFWAMHTEPDKYAAMHSSPYNYDTFVPIILCSPGVPATTSYAAVGPRQIAPTLAALLAITAPSGAASAELLPGVVESVRR